MNDNGEYCFKNLFDQVDVDEKWFWMSCNSENYIAVNSDYYEDSDYKNVFLPVGLVT